MNIKITSFTNPFSFFCVNKDFIGHIKDDYLTEFNQSIIDKNISNKSRSTLLDANHGQVSSPFC